MSASASSVEPARVAHLDGVPQGAAPPPTAVKAARPVVRASWRRAHRSAPARSRGKRREEGAGSVAIERQLGRQLPEDRAQRRTEAQNSRREEVGQRGLEAAQLQHVRDVAAALDREHEPVRDLPPPGVARRGAGERIERPVHLDGRQPRREKSELARLDQSRGIEIAAPARVQPAARADDAIAVPRPRQASSAGRRSVATIGPCGRGGVGSRARNRLLAGGV